jgi:hypothetical protein
VFSIFEEVDLVAMLFEYLGTTPARASAMPVPPRFRIFQDISRCGVARTSDVDFLLCYQDTILSSDRHRPSSSLSYYYRQSIF